MSGGALAAMREMAWAGGANRALVRPPSLTRLRGPWPAVLLIVALAFVTRAPLFGDPLIHMDEQFYLMVGERMLHGAVPFVDIWDRKPIGLFLLYEGLAAIGPDPVVQYQVAATLAAAATALAIYRLALRVASPDGALTAACCYLFLVLTLNGAGGQSPVFYNLPVVLCAWGVLRLMEHERPRLLALKGAALMLVVGLMIQVKYTVMFDGLFLGLALLAAAMREHRALRPVAARGLLWIAAALLPTIAVYAVYAHIGAADAFEQANFWSIFGRHDNTGGALLRLALAAALLSPFWIASRRVVPPSSVYASGLSFFWLWFGFGLAGYLLLGSYYDHYAIPLLPPLLVATSPGLGWEAARRRITSVAVAVAVLTGAGAAVMRAGDEGGSRDLDRLTRIVAPRLHGCLYVYEGPPMLYQTTGACLATRFVFPSHLNNRKERAALGVDPVAETRRILDSHPAVVVTYDAPRPTLTNERTRAYLFARLRAGYRHVAEVPLGGRRVEVFERADIPEARA